MQLWGRDSSLFGLAVQSYFRCTHLKTICFVTSTLNACIQNFVLPSNILSTFWSVFWNVMSDFVQIFSWPLTFLKEWYNKKKIKNYIFFWDSSRQHSNAWIPTAEMSISWNSLKMHLKMQTSKTYLGSFWYAKGQMANLNGPEH